MGRTPLQDAAETGDLPTLQRLLDSKEYDIEEADHSELYSIKGVG
jgi:hypothetical protein